MGERVAIVGGGAGQLADLLERAFVREQLDPLAHRELAPPPLLGDAGLAAHLRRERPALGEFFDFGFPNHLSGSF